MSNLTEQILTSLKTLLEAPISLSLIILSVFLISTSITHDRYINIGVITLVYAVFTGYWRLFAKDVDSSTSHYPEFVKKYFAKGKGGYHIVNGVMSIIWSITLLYVVFQ